MSSPAKPASPGACPQPLAALTTLGRVGVLMLAYPVAVATVAASLPALVLAVPVAVLFPDPPKVVARTPTLSVPSPEPAP